MGRMKDGYIEIDGSRVLLCPTGRPANCHKAHLKALSRDYPYYTVETAVATRAINAIVDSLDRERAHEGVELALVPVDPESDGLVLVWRVQDPDAGPPIE